MGLDDVLPPYFEPGTILRLLTVSHSSSLRFVYEASGPDDGDFEDVSAIAWSAAPYSTTTPVTWTQWKAIVRRDTGSGG